MTLSEGVPKARRDYTVKLCWIQCWNFAVFSVAIQAWQKIPWPKILAIYFFKNITFGVSLQFVCVFLDRSNCSAAILTFKASILPVYYIEISAWYSGSNKFIFLSCVFEFVWNESYKCLLLLPFYSQIIISEQLTWRYSHTHIKF